jgi:hypothetical protein
MMPNTQFELERVLMADAIDLIQCREKSKLLHASSDIDASGDEVEIPVRRIIEKWLPKSCYIGHGHIVDSDIKTSPQLDVIIAEKDKSQILFTAENGTEYFPYESIYAIGEIKSTYYEGHIQEFSETIKQIKDGLRRNPVMPKGFDLRSYVNPLHSFMFFVNSGAFELQKIVNFYENTENFYLPNTICFLDKGILLNCNADPYLRKLGDVNLDLEYKQGRRNHWAFVPFGNEKNRSAASLAYLIFSLNSQISAMRLSNPDLHKYFHSFFAHEKPLAFALKDN